MEIKPESLTKLQEAAKVLTDAIGELTNPTPRFKVGDVVYGGIGGLVRRIMELDKKGGGIYEPLENGKWGAPDFFGENPNYIVLPVSLPSSMYHMASDGTWYVLSGEYRSPKEGEWFIDSIGDVTQSLIVFPPDHRKFILTRREHQPKFKVGDKVVRQGGVLSVCRIDTYDEHYVYDVSGENPNVFETHLEDCQLTPAPVVEPGEYYRPKDEHGFTDFSPYYRVLNDGSVQYWRVKQGAWITISDKPYVDALLRQAKPTDYSGEWIRTSDNVRYRITKNESGLRYEFLSQHGDWLTCENLDTTRKRIHAAIRNGELTRYVAPKPTLAEVLNKHEVRLGDTDGGKKLGTPARVGMKVRASGLDGCQVINEIMRNKYTVTRGYISLLPAGITCDSHDITPVLVDGLPVFEEVGK